MSEKETVAVTILDKEYLVASPEEEKGELEQSARYLDEKCVKSAAADASSEPSVLP